MSTISPIHPASLIHCTNRSPLGDRRGTAALQLSCSSSHCQAQAGSDPAILISSVSSLRRDSPIHHYMLLNNRRAMTPSPKKSSKTRGAAAQRNSQLLKQLVSRCCMAQKLRQYLEQVLMETDDRWNEIVGVDGIGWDHNSESFMELCDEVNPQFKARTKLNEQMVKLTLLENDLLNALEDIVEVVCLCIRRHNRKYNEQRSTDNSGEERLDNKNFFKSIVTSESFKNSLQEKIQYREKSSTCRIVQFSDDEDEHDTSQGSSSPSTSPTVQKANGHLKYLSREGLTDDDQFLQLGRRRGIVKNMIDVIAEVISSVDSPLFAPKKIELEDSYDRLCIMAQKHEKLISLILSSSSSSSPLKTEVPTFAPGRFLY